MPQHTTLVQIESISFDCIFDFSSGINVISLEHFKKLQNSLNREFKLLPVAETFLRIDKTIIAFYGSFTTTLKIASKTVEAIIYVSLQPISHPILNSNTYLQLQ